MRNIVLSCLAAIALGACSADHSDVCQYLKSREGFPDPASLGAEGESVALLRCIAGGNRESAVRLVEAGVQAPQALAFAVRDGDIRLVRAVVDGGASPDAAEWLAAKPVLSAAASTGDLELVRALLDAGADPDTSPPAGFGPPLRAAARADEIEVMTLLLQRGADPDVLNEEGQTMLWQLACISEPSEHRDRLLRVLLGAAPNLEAREPDPEGWHGRTPLACAAKRGDQALVKELLARQANPDALVDDGRTILELISSDWDSDPEMVKLLEMGGATRERVTPSSAEIFRALEAADIEDARAYHVLGCRPERLAPYVKRPAFEERYADAALLSSLAKDLDGDGQPEVFVVLRKAEGAPEPVLLAALGRSNGSWSALHVREGRLGDPVVAAFLEDVPGAVRVHVFEIRYQCDDEQPIVYDLRWDPGTRRIVAPYETRALHPFTRDWNCGE